MLLIFTETVFVTNLLFFYLTLFVLWNRILWNCIYYILTTNTCPSKRSICIICRVNSWEHCAPLAYEIFIFILLLNDWFSYSLVSFMFKVTYCLVPIFVSNMFVKSSNCITILGLGGNVVNLAQSIGPMIYNQVNQYAKQVSFYVYICM